MNLDIIRIFPKIIALKAIRFYQKIFSADHGWLSIFYPFGRCRFRPTCSDYAYQAIEKYGLLKGGIKALYRILRCNPFNKGGDDPVN